MSYRVNRETKLRNNTENNTAVTSTGSNDLSLTYWCSNSKLTVSTRPGEYLKKNNN